MIRGRTSSAVDLIASRQFYSSSLASVASVASDAEPQIQEDVKPTSKSPSKRDNIYQSRNIPNPYVKSVRWIDAERRSLLGKQYNDILHKGRGGRAIGLSDLRNLLGMCEEPAHVTYAVGAVEYYQKKGMDFAEDVNALFIRACVKGKNPMAATHHMLKVS